MASKKPKKSPGGPPPGQPKKSLRYYQLMLVLELIERCSQRNIKLNIRDAVIAVFPALTSDRGIKFKIRRDDPRELADIAAFKVEKELRKKDIANLERQFRTHKGELKEYMRRCQVSLDERSVCAAIGRLPILIQRKLNG